MPGPPPKDPALRARRNKVAGASSLEDNRQRARVPPLGRRRGPDGAIVQRGAPGDWLPETRAWWRDVWRSPMAARFLKVEIHGLHLVARLRDDFWRSPSPTLAAELRQQEQRWGLDQLARWRLQWEVVSDLRERAATDSAPPPPAPDAPGPAPADDPGRVLLALVPPPKRATA